MQDDEIIRRARDLSAQSQNQGFVTSTGFLTPAEAASVSAERLPGLLLTGGVDGCERQAAFFLPDYAAPADFDVSEHIAAIRSTTRFGEPGHRDYMGALLGLGLQRRCIGDIFVTGETALFFCQESIADFILENLDKVGRYGAALTRVSLADANVPERPTEDLRFTVQSPRLDTVVSGLFSVSRTAAAEAIRGGLVTLNHLPAGKQDAPVSERDTLSLRGRGKAVIDALGAPTRKGRIPVTARKYI